jgi:predicted acyl esterase
MMILAKKRHSATLKDIKPAVMTVGGWFDAEDLYGPLNTYQTRKPVKIIILLLLWGHGHGDWARNGAKAIGNINFGDSISGFFQKNIEAIFFRRFLKDNGKAKINYRKPTYLTRDRKVGKPITLLKMQRRKAFIWYKIN